MELDLGLLHDTTYRECTIRAVDSSPHIEFRKVSKRLGGLEVLRGLDLRVERGEKVALIGPSGSGKTTVLRLLMTLETFDEGEVLLAGEPLWHEVKNGVRALASEKHLQRMRREVGMVFQQFNLFPHMSAEDNVALPAVWSRGLSEPDARTRARDLLAQVGLSHKLKNYPGELSGGQKQRVAIARALALEPKLMLFDEVTSALDPELVEEVLSVLRNLADRADITMLLVTHEMSFAHEIADRVVFLDKGRVVESGTPDEIFRAPKEPRTQEFLKRIVAAGLRLN